MTDFNIDYTARDYDSLVAAADAFAQSILPEWLSRDDNDINWATIKTVAYLVSIGMFYIDLGVNEQDPYEVQIYTNALVLARRYGMPVTKIIGASTALDITIPVSLVNKTIARGTEFTYETYKYALWEDLVFPAGTTELPGSVYFGEFERYQLGISDGTDFQSFIIDRADVEDRKVRILINESGDDYATDPNGFEEWSPVDTLVMSYETDQHYRLVLNKDEKYEVHFGDDKSGKRLVNSAVVVVEVLTIVDGYADMNYGNLPVGNITETANAEIESVVQSEIASGGADKESIASIARNLPQWISTANRGVAPSDFRYLSRRVAGVKDASVYPVDSVMNIYIITQDGSPASSVLLQDVLDFLTPRTLEYLTLNTLVPSPVPFDLTVDIVVEDTKKRAVVKGLVEGYLADYLNKPKEVGRVVKIQDAYDILHDTDGVELSEVTALHKSSVGSAVLNTALDVSETSEVGTLTVNATGGIL